MPRRYPWPLLMVSVCGLLAGCSLDGYARKADESAYGVLAEKQREALGLERAFDVEYGPFREGANPFLLGGLPIPMAGLTAADARVLSLNECLELACHNSRAFQDRKEALYSAALRLANARHDWSFFGGGLSGSTRGDAAGGGPAGWDTADASRLDFARRFANGGRLTLGLALDLASDLLGWNSTTLGSNFDSNFTQPLLRGAWRGLAYEDLYRRERDLAIAVLDYERFTQTFSADIASQYYQVLRELDTLANERANIERLERNLSLVRVQVEAGERSRIEQDQAETSLLNARVSLTRSLQAYQNQLDRYKITLGLPVGADVVLDPSELGVLIDRGLVAVPIEEEQAITLALKGRPDVLGEIARIRDAARDVDIAADAFLPLLDAQVGYGAAGTGPHEPTRLRFNEGGRYGQLDLDYPFDQTDNRDNYRLAQIARARAWRQYEAFLDNVRLEVRSAYRQLAQAYQAYEIQVRNVAVAERRSLLALEEQRAGLNNARDVLEAEEGLRDARIGLTRALVDYESTRLTFLARLGLLDVDENGKIHERDEAFQYERLEARYGSPSAGL